MSERAGMPSTYDTDISREPGDTGGTCEMDGYVYDGYAREFYWHCEEPATMLAKDYGTDKHGDEDGEPPTEILVCADHAQEFEETEPLREPDDIACRQADETGEDE